MINSTLSPVENLIILSNIKLYIKLYNNYKNYINLYIFNRDDNTHVVLKLLENDHRVRETVYGREYKVRAEFTKPNGKK